MNVNNNNNNEPVNINYELLTIIIKYFSILMLAIGIINFILSTKYLPLEGFQPFGFVTGSILSLPLIILNIIQLVLCKFKKALLALLVIFFIFVLFEIILAYYNILFIIDTLNEFYGIDLTAIFQ